MSRSRPLFDLYELKSRVTFWGEGVTDGFYLYHSSSICTCLLERFFVDLAIFSYFSGLHLFFSFVTGRDRNGPITGVYYEFAWLA